MQRHRQVTRHYISAPDLTRFVRSWATTIDNRILLSRHHSQVSLHRQKKQFHVEKIRWTLRKTGFYLAEEYATSQLHCSSWAEVNKFLPAYVILFNAFTFSNISPSIVTMASPCISSEIKQDISRKS